MCSVCFFGHDLGTHTNVGVLIKETERSKEREEEL